jgi:hypothetical protein
MDLSRRMTTGLLMAAWAAAGLGAGLGAGGAAAQEVALGVGEPMEAVARWEAAPDTVFDAREVDLDDFLYLARPIVVFADNSRDPAFVEQMEELSRDLPQLVERDVLIVVDADRESGSALRLRLRPRGFMLAILGKDGQVMLRKPLPWTVREIGRSIDKMPIRQREIRERS